MTRNTRALLLNNLALLVGYGLFGRIGLGITAGLLLSIQFFG